MIEEDRLSHALKACEKLKQRRINRKRAIYIMKCDKYYKIGYATDIYQRFTNYRVHNPLDVSMVCQSHTPRFKQYEHWMRKRFTHKLHRGEWYLLNDDDIKVIQARWFKELKEQNV